MNKYLYVKQKHIDETNRIKQEGNGYFPSSTSCPIVLAAREQVNSSWTGAFNFLHCYATPKGTRLGVQFMNLFDNDHDVSPIRIPLRTERIKDET